MENPTEKEEQKPELDYESVATLLNELMMRRKEPVCECECPNGGAGANSGTNAPT
jgi:hypothetical protein